MTLFKQDPEFSVHGLLHPKHGGKSEEILTEFANQIIQVETSAANFSHKIINEFWPNSELNEAGGSATSIASSVDTTKRQVSQATNSPSLDEDDYDIL